MEQDNVNKWQTWYDSLPEHTKEYLKTQPIWSDRDLFVVALVGFISGLVLGLIY